MDIKHNKGYHGRLKVSGVGQPTHFKGSLMEIMSQALSRLSQVQARPTADGNKVIELRFAMEPITDDFMELTNKIAEVESMIPDSMTVREEAQPGETPEQFAARLDAKGYPPMTVKFLTADEFDLSIDMSRYDSWIADPRAKRFRLLCASPREREAAGKNEFSALQAQCESEWPEFTTHIHIVY